MSPLVLALLAADGRAASCDDASASAGVVINEFLANPASSDTGKEWVEVFNGTGRSVDLSGWTIAAGTSSLSDSSPFPPGTVLASGAFLLVGQDQVPDAQVVVTGMSLGNASNADALQLRDCLGGVADTIVYGEPNTDGWVGDGGDDTSGPVPKDDVSLGRSPDGHDTDTNADDIVALPYTTPGRANDAPPDTCGGPGSGLVLNEVLPNPEGSDDGFEWVELYHAGSSTIDLTGWSLRMGTSSLSAKHTWDSGTIAPGQRLLLGGIEVANADIVVESMSLGNATSNADIVAVVDCLGFASDTLVYGTPNDDAFVDDTGEVATRLAPAPGEGSALQRAMDGLDTDDNASDWVTTTEPSPGAPNPEVEPVVCEPSGGSVRINEFVSDPEGSDEGLEWVELYNASADPVSVSGWALSFGTSDYDSLGVVLGGGVLIPGHGFLVIGGADVPEADIVASFSIGNGTETDGIRLFDCERAVVDTVLYGDSPNADLMTDDNGEVVEPYGDPGSAEALARLEDGVDTDTAADWKVVGITTPGESNVRDLGALEDPLEGHRGCGQKAPSAEGTPNSGPQPTDPNGGCDTSSRTVPLLVSLLVARLARRRRPRS
ncbi:MAG: lamin tail domain-containing protein [Myxococcales bacterium]|nr:lamin tail domain-containing protein [Myxococcales bacterium]